MKVFEPWFVGAPLGDASRGSGQYCVVARAPARVSNFPSKPHFQSSPPSFFLEQSVFLSSKFSPPSALCCPAADVTTSQQSTAIPIILLQPAAPIHASPSAASLPPATSPYLFPPLSGPGLPQQLRKGGPRESPCERTLLYFSSSR